MPKITAVVGARPNFIKISPIFEELRKYSHFTLELIHTGQHYLREMSDSIFEDLQIPQPNLNLEISENGHVRQMAGVMQKLEPALTANRPDVLLVVGDVTSTVAAAMVGAKMGIPVAHVEAGLRSFDLTMPEELNRIVTDVVSTYLFASEPSGVRNLQAAGIPAERVFLVGNVMIDTLKRFHACAMKTEVLERLGARPGEYVVTTLHRPSNVDDPARLRRMLDMLAALAGKLRVIFPVHPRTRGRIEALGVALENVTMTPPLGYLEFIRLISGARLVITDSGGLQEETTYLRIPCLTARTNTERPITVDEGSNQIVGNEPEAVLERALAAIANPPCVQGPPALWDGNAARRIAEILARQFPA
jgi:UDP-N-acetylglucosamine 2-epimerase (non-hydrolysing)